MLFSSKRRRFTASTSNRGHGPIQSPRWRRSSLVAVLTLVISGLQVTLSAPASAASGLTLTNLKQLAEFPSNGGALSSEKCPAGDVMVGLSGQLQTTGQSMWITDMLTSCQPMTVSNGVVVPSGTVASVGTDGTPNTPIGATGNKGTFTLNCAANQVVVGFEAWTDSSGNTLGVHGYQVICSALNAAGVPTGSVTSFLAGVKSGTDSTLQVCFPTSAGAPGGVGAGYAGVPVSGTPNRAGASSLWCGQVQVSVAAPVLTATAPVSPGNVTTPSVVGTAPAGTTVSIYTNASCQGTAAATGSPSGLASGIPVTVPANVTTSMSANASANGVTSPCSNSLSYLEDSIPPTLTGTVTTSPDLAGWYSGDVTIHWTCSDAGSGIATCPGDSTITGEGSNLSATATATDNAGNTTTKTVSGIKIDRTAPSSVATIAGNETNGWYNSLPLTVVISTQDNLSGASQINYTLDGTAGIITGASGSVSIAATGHHTLSMSAVDAAGNVEASHSFGIDVDTSAPVITSALSPAPTNMWNNSAVQASITCADQTLADGSMGSGVAGCSLGSGSTSATNTDGSATSSLNLTTEGRYQLTGTASDLAGNTGSLGVAANIDLTPPVITYTLSPPAPNGSNGWYTSPVIVTFSCSDPDLADHTAGSGVASCPAPVTLGSDGSGQSASGTATDLAGNAASLTVSGINIDQTAPGVAVTYNGSATKQAWYKQAVTLHFTCTDVTSKVASCPDDVTLNGEGSNQSVSVSSTDNADNSTPVDVNGINIDLTAPFIRGRIVPTPNANGWNNTAASIHWHCFDPTLADGTPGSGVASCPPHQGVSTEGNGQVFTGTAADVAGNTSSPTTVTANLDLTPPTLTGAASTPPNGSNGWYTTPVAIHWTASDALSGIDPSTVPVDAVLSSDGKDLSATASVSDLAGNSTTADSSPVNIDQTQPSTALASGPPTWSNGSVTLDLVATDTGSGVAATYYSIDDGTQQTGTVVTIDTEGRHQVTFYSVDNAGNTEKPANLITVNVDKTAPTVAPSQSPTANKAGWNNTPVQVTFTCVDPNLADGTAGSGLASCTSSPSGSSHISGDTESGTATVTISSEGPNQTVQGSATDNAGNTGTGNTSLSIDTTPPTISASSIPSANIHGWYNAPVTVGFTCADPPATTNGTAASGIATCDNQETVSTDGANRSVTAQAADVAGNTSSATVSGLNLDQTKPIITPVLNPSTPNGANGWYTEPISVHFDVSDALSGIDPGTVPGNQLFATDGAGQQASASVSDLAGNVNTATTGKTINIDQTAPTVTFSQSVSAPNGSNGWYNTPVTVTFTCTDATSGVTSCPGALTLTTGTHAAETFIVSDKAGNTTSVTVPEIDVDTVPPTISFTGNAGSYQVNQQVTITCSATDNLSGIDPTQTTCASVNAPAYAFLVGSNTLKGHATDLAGNFTDSSTTFTVGVTCSSLESLVSKFDSSTNITQALDVKLSNACTAPTPTAKAGMIGAFDNQVRAETGKTLTAAQANTLTFWAGLL